MDYKIIQSRPVISDQKHAATRLHWDLRLEVDGVLKSWAVTNEPTLDPSIKRLAVQTEDHPMKYATFEGDIPKGNYGAGHVDIWDRGTFTPVGVEVRNLPKKIDGDWLKFELRGRRMKGAFALVRLDRDGSETKKNWLLIKLPDPSAKPKSSSELTSNSRPTGAGLRKRGAPDRSRRSHREQR